MFSCVVQAVKLAPIRRTNISVNIHPIFRFIFVFPFYFAFTAATAGEKSPLCGTAKNKNAVQDHSHTA